MSAVSIATNLALPAAAPATRYRSIRVTRGHVVAVLLATLVIAVLDLAFLFDKVGKPGIWKILAFEPFVSLLLFTTSLLAWLVVAAEPSGRTRWSMLVVASLVSAALTAAVTMPIATAMGIDQVWQAIMEKTRSMPPEWLRFIGNTVHLSIYAFLFIAAAQNIRLRSATQRAVLSAQRGRPPSHAGSGRRLIDAGAGRPQFLFDRWSTLKRGIEDAPQAAEDSRPLITYSRSVARMREEGSRSGQTIG